MTTGGESSATQITATDLLVTLATDLARQSERVPEVLANPDQYVDSISKYMLAQGVSESALFQLPEPILHPIANPDLLVVGFNPNFGPDEDIPRYGASLEEYVAFYANRFAPERRDAEGRPAETNAKTGSVSYIKHYDKVEKLVGEVLGTEYRLL